MEAALLSVRRRADSTTWIRSFPADLPPVSADPVLLETVLVNVLDNAAKHGGAAVTMAAHAREGVVDLTITDDGTGIAPTLLPHVFDLFTRAPSGLAAPGAGLGLSICKGLIEAMGGTIVAASPVAEGRGTRISITLPAGATPTGASEAAQ